MQNKSREALFPAFSDPEYALPNQRPAASGKRTILRAARLHAGQRGGSSTIPDPWGSTPPASQSHPTSSTSSLNNPSTSGGITKKSLPNKQKNGKRINKHRETKLPVSCNIENDPTNITNNVILDATASDNDNPSAIISRNKVAFQEVDVFGKNTAIAILKHKVEVDEVEMSFVCKCHPCGNFCDLNEYQSTHLNECVPPAVQFVKVNCVCGNVFRIEKRLFLASDFCRHLHLNNDRDNLHLNEVTIQEDDDINETITTFNRLNVSDNENESQNVNSIATNSNTYEENVNLIADDMDLYTKNVKHPTEMVLHDREVSVVSEDEEIVMTTNSLTEPVVETIDNAILYANVVREDEEIIMTTNSLTEPVVESIDNANIFYENDTSTNVSNLNENEITEETNDEESSEEDSSYVMTDNESEYEVHIISDAESRNGEFNDGITNNEDQSQDDHHTELPDEIEEESALQNNELLYLTDQNNSNDTENLEENYETTRVDTMASDVNGSGDPDPGDGIGRLDNSEQKVEFEEMCAMFKFDFLRKRWMPRGLGMMLILYNPENNTSKLQFQRLVVFGEFRVTRVMPIHPGLRLQRMKYNNRAWEWTYHYLTPDGNGEFENLAVRFSSQDVADSFLVKFEEVKKQLSQNDSSHLMICRFATTCPAWPPIREVATPSDVLSAYDEVSSTFNASSPTNGTLSPTFSGIEVDTAVQTDPNDGVLAGMSKGVHFDVNIPSTSGTSQNFKEASNNEVIVHELKEIKDKQDETFAEVKIISSLIKQYSVNSQEATATAIAEENENGGNISSSDADEDKTQENDGSQKELNQKEKNSRINSDPNGEASGYSVDFEPRATTSSESNHYKIGHDDPRGEKQTKKEPTVSKGNGTQIKFDNKIKGEKRTVSVNKKYIKQLKKYPEVIDSGYTADEDIESDFSNSKQNSVMKNDIEIVNNIEQCTNNENRDKLREDNTNETQKTPDNVTNESNSTINPREAEILSQFYTFMRTNLVGLLKSNASCIENGVIDYDQSNSNKNTEQQQSLQTTEITDEIKKKSEDVKENIAKTLTVNVEKPVKNATATINDVNRDYQSDGDINKDQSKLVGNVTTSSNITAEEMDLVEPKGDNTSTGEERHNSDQKSYSIVEKNSVMNQNNNDRIEPTRAFGTQETNLSHTAEEKDLESVEPKGYNILTEGKRHNSDKDTVDIEKNNKATNNEGATVEKANTTTITIASNDKKPIGNATTSSNHTAEEKDLETVEPKGNNTFTAVKMHSSDEDIVDTKKETKPTNNEGKTTVEKANTTTTTTTTTTSTTTIAVNDKKPVGNSANSSDHTSEEKDLESVEPKVNNTLNEKERHDSGENTVDTEKNIKATNNEGATVEKANTTTTTIAVNDKNPVEKATTSSNHTAEEKDLETVEPKGNNTFTAVKMHSSDEDIVDTKKETKPTNNEGKTTVEKANTTTTTTTITVNDKKPVGNSANSSDHTSEEKDLESVEPKVNNTLNEKERHDSGENTVDTEKNTKATNNEGATVEKANTTTTIAVNDKNPVEKATTSSNHTNAENDPELKEPKRDNAFTEEKRHSSDENIVDTEKKDIANTETVPKELNTNKIHMRPHQIAIKTMRLCCKIILYMFGLAVVTLCTILLVYFFEDILLSMECLE